MRRLSWSVYNEKGALAWVEDETVLVYTGAYRQPLWRSIWNENGRFNVHVVYYHNGITPNEHSSLVWLWSYVITYRYVYWIVKLNVRFELPEQPIIKLLSF